MTILLKLIRKFGFTYNFAKLPANGLALCCFVVYSARLFVLCIGLSCFVPCFFGPSGVAVASLGEVCVCVGGGGGGGGMEAYLSAFVRLFDLCLFGFVGFSLPLGA